MPFHGGMAREEVQQRLVRRVAMRRRLPIREGRKAVAILASPVLGYGEDEVAATRNDHSPLLRSRLLHAHPLGDRRRDKARVDQGTVIVQHRDEVRRIDAVFVDHQLLQLRVAVLLDHEHLVVRVDELQHVFAERKGADAQRVQVHALPFQAVQRLADGGRGRP